MLRITIRFRHIYIIRLLNIWRLENKKRLNKSPDSVGYAKFTYVFHYSSFYRWTPFLLIEKKLKNIFNR